MHSSVSITTEDNGGVTDGAVRDGVSVEGKVEAGRWREANKRSMRTYKTRMVNSVISSIHEALASRAYFRPKKALLEK